MILVMAGTSGTAQGKDGDTTPVIIPETLPGTHEMILTCTGYSLPEQSVSAGSSRTSHGQCQVFRINGICCRYRSLVIITDGNHVPYDTYFVICDQLIK